MKTKDYIIYVDMDGVIVDFDRTWKKEFGFDLKKFYNRFFTINKLNNMDESEIVQRFNFKFWRLMQESNNFFKYAKPMFGWWLLKLYLNNKIYLILTGLPSEKYVEYYYKYNSIKEGKLEWASYYFTGIGMEFVELCEDGNGSAKAKNKYVNPNIKSILIDDNAENIKSWIESGGIGIHHKGMISTILKLKRELIK